MHADEAGRARPAPGLLGLRCLSISLSLSLVVITGGVIGTLSNITGRRATDEAKETAQHGIDAAQELCVEGFGMLQDTGAKGQAACFAAGRGSAEFLIGLLLEQVRVLVTDRLINFLTPPMNAVQQTYRLLAALNPADAVDPTLWRKAYSKAVSSAFRQIQPYGATELQVISGFDQYSESGATRTGVPLHRVRSHLEFPGTIGNPPGGYHPLVIAQWPPIDCQEGYTRAQCVARSCPWCVPVGGLAPAYCGHPRRMQAGKIMMCRTGYTPAAGYEPPWYADRVAYGFPDDNGELYIGSCGVDKECGCEAFSDYLLKKGGPGGGRPGDATYTELALGGRYRRADGTYPKSGTTSKAEVYEPGICPVPREITSMLNPFLARQVGWGGVRAAGDVHWAPLGASFSLPIIALQVSMRWNNPSGDMTAGIIWAATETSRISQFLQEATLNLPPHSRVYAVQADPWRALPSQCKDDPNGLVNIMTFDCPTLVNTLLPLTGLNCDSDISVLSPENLRHSIFVWEECPASCGRCPYRRNETVGLLLGASHGDVTWRIPQNMSHIEVREGNETVILRDKRPLHVLRSSDPVIRSHAEWVFSLPEDFRSFDASQMTLWNDTEQVTWYQKAAAVPMPSPEHEPFVLYLVILVQRAQAMLQMDRALNETQRAVDKDNAEARSRFDKASEETMAAFYHEIGNTERRRDFLYTVTYVAAVVIALMLMAVSVIFVHLIIAPLLVLNGDMSKVARMQLDDVNGDRPLSSLKEVAQMQASFYTMVRNLIEYRNYMPQSILCEDSPSDPGLDGDLEELVPLRRLSVGDGADAAHPPGTGSDPPTSALSEKFSCDFQLPASVKQPGAAPDGDLGGGGLNDGSGKFNSGLKSRADRSATYAYASPVLDQIGHPVASPRSVVSPTSTAARRSLEHQIRLPEVVSPRGKLFLKRRQVSFAACNVRGWLGAAELQPEADLMHGHRDFLQRSLSIVTKHKGIPDPFCGDRLLGSFNGVKQCATHCSLAASAASELYAQLSGAGVALSVSCASGDVRFGNMGCTGAKRFTFAGGCFTWVWALERLNSELRTRVLCDKWIIRDVAGVLLLRRIDEVSFPKRASVPLTVFELVGERQAAAQEWMYVLEGAAKENPYKDWDEFVAETVAENWEEAARLYARLDDQRSTAGRCPPGPVLERWGGRLQRRQHAPTLISYH